MSCKNRDHKGIERLLMPGPYLPNSEFGQTTAFIAIKIDYFFKQIELFKSSFEIKSKTANSPIYSVC